MAGNRKPHVRVTVVEEKIMVKVLVVLLFFLLDSASVAGFLFLDKMIDYGDIQIAAGQRQIIAGKAEVEAGKEGS